MGTPEQAPRPGYDAELDYVTVLVREAAEIARRRAEKAKPSEKANQSFVTDLDLELEQFLRARLAARFPDDRLTGEEYAAGGGSGPRRWSIDPIDGTGNLVHGLPLWAVSVGLIDDGTPVLGVIVIPPLRELFWAVIGRGAWRDGAALKAVDADVLHDQDNICLGTNAMRAIDPRSLPGRLRDLGSACCELTFTACNRLQASTFLGEATHDVAAGAVIAAESGCSFGTLDGRLLTPSEMVASAPITIPTFVAPPRRLNALLAAARRYPDV